MSGELGKVTNIGVGFNTFISEMKEKKIRRVGKNTDDKNNPININPEKSLHTLLQ